MEDFYEDAFDLDAKEVSNIRRNECYDDLLTNLLYF